MISLLPSPLSQSFSWYLPESVPLLRAVYTKNQIETIGTVCQCFQKHRIELFYRADIDRVSISSCGPIPEELLVAILYAPALVNRYKDTLVMPYLEKNPRQEISSIQFVRCSYDRRPPFAQEIDCFVMKAKRICHIHHFQKNQVPFSIASWESRVRAYLLNQELCLQSVPPLPFPPLCAGALTHYLHPQTEGLVYPLLVLDQEPIIPLGEEVTLGYMKELVAQLEDIYVPLGLMDREHPLTFSSPKFALRHRKMFFRLAEEGLFVLQEGKVPTAALEAFWYECAPLFSQHILYYGYYWCVLQVLGEEKFNQLFSLSSVCLQIGGEIYGDFCPLAPLVEKIYPTIQSDLILDDVTIDDICYFHCDVAIGDICYFHFSSALNSFSFSPEVIGAYALCVGENADGKPLFSSAACRVPHTERAFRDWLIRSFERYLHLQKNICEEEVYNHLSVYLEATPYCDLTVYRLNWRALASLQQASDVAKAYFALLCAQEKESFAPPLYREERQRADTTESQISIISEE